MTVRNRVRREQMKRVASIIVMFALLVFSAQVSWADGLDNLRKEMQQLRDDYESRIDELQSQIDSLSKNQDKKIDEMQEVIDKKGWNAEYVGRYNGPFEKGGLIVRNPSGFGNVSVGGYMDIEFGNFENNDSFFKQHRWIINIGAELAERLRFFSEYEIEYGGPDAQNAGDGEAKVEQAWIDYLIEDWINLRIGALLVPFGRYNLYHDSDLQDLTDRPLVARDIIPTTWTESGAGFYGEFNPTIGSYEDLVVGYETYVINGLDDDFSDTGIGNAKGSLKEDNNNSKAVVGRLVLSPAIGHEIGFSGYWGKYNDLDDNITGKAIDWLSTWGPLEIVGEYAHFNVDEPDFTTGSSTDVPKTFDGYRIQANYHFWPEFLNDTFLGRGFEDPTFTLVSRYGWAKIDDDSDATTGDNEESRYTLGFNYRPIESWVLKFEYQWSRTENEALERGDNDGFLMSVAMGF